MSIDWSQKETPVGPQVPDLRRLQFEWVMTTKTAQGNYLEDILNTVLEALKPTEPAYYREIKSRVAGQGFSYVDTMAMIELFRPYITALYPAETVTAEAILAIWNEALEQ